MIEFVNKFTGGRMWVADDRKEEYTAAGHKPAASSSAKETTEAADEITVRKARRTKKDGNSK